MPRSAAGRLHRRRRGDSASRLRPTQEALTMSIAQRGGLPEAFQTTLLILAVVLALTPYLADVSSGILKVPRLTSGQRRSMKIVGPLTVLFMLLLVVPWPALAPVSQLRLLAADATDTGEIDVAIKNDGTSAVLLTRLEIEVLRDRGLRLRPVLAPTAAYRLRMDDLAAGSKRALTMRHLLPP